MKNKKGLIIAIVIGLILIIAGVLLLFLLPKKSKSQMYVDAITKSLGLESSHDNKIEEELKEIEKKLEKNNYKLTINTKETQDEAGYKYVEDIIYVGNKKMYLKETATANALTYVYEAMLKDNKFYLGAKDLLDNVYYLDKIDEMLGSTNKDDDSFDKMAGYIEDALVDSIKNKDVTVGSSELKVNGSTYNTTLYSYTFTGETLYDIVVNLAESLKKDKDFYKILNTIVKESGTAGGSFTITKEVADALLDQIIASAGSLKKMGKVLSYSVYMYDDEPIGIMASVYSDEQPLTIEYYEVEKNDKGYIKLTASTAGNEIFSFEYNEKTKGNSDITVSTNKKEIVKGYLKENNGNYEFKLYGTEDDSKYILITVNSDRTGTIQIVSDLANRVSDFKLEKVDEIPEMDVTNSVSLDDITESDYEKLLTLAGLSLQMFRNEGDTYFGTVNSLDM